MNRKFWLPFWLTFGSVFAFYAALAFRAGGFQSYADILQVSLMIAVLAAFFAALVAFSAARNAESGSNEPLEFAAEVAAGAGNYISSFKLLRLKSLYPVWQCILLSALGIFLLERVRFLPGALLIFASQVICLAHRKRIRHFVASDPRIAPHLEGPLHWILWAWEFFVLLSLVAVVGALSAHGQTQNVAGVLILGAVLGLGVQAAWYRARGENWDLVFPIKWLLTALWVTLFSMTVNFGFDFRAPMETHTITYRDCPSLLNQYFTAGGEKIEPTDDPQRFDGCEVFGAAAIQHLDAKVEVTRRLGALGIAWRQTRIIP